MHHPNNQQCSDVIYLRAEVLANVCMHVKQKQQYMSQGLSDNSNINISSYVEITRHIISNINAVPLQLTYQHHFL